MSRTGDAAGAESARRPVGASFVGVSFVGVSFVGVSFYGLCVGASLHGAPVISPCINRICRGRMMFFNEGFE